MFLAEGGRPNDRRGFIHKSFIGRAVGKAVTTFVPGASIARDVIGTARSIFRKPRARATVPRTLTARPSIAGEQGKALGRDLKFGGPAVGPPMISIQDFAPPRPRPIVGGGGSPCRTGESTRCCQLRNGDFTDQRQYQRECVTAGNGAAPTEVGEAVMGRYGAALEPGVMMIERSVCLPGMNLGNDGLCYNKGAITNKQRQWPRGRRPLLTGGDMRAIGIAARAGSKLDRTTKRLRALGMMKALPKGRGRPPAHAHAKPVAAVSV